MTRQLGGNKVTRILTLLGVLAVLIFACLSRSSPLPAGAQTPPPYPGPPPPGEENGTSVPCLEDLAEPSDGRIDISDIVSLMPNFGTASPPTPVKYDINESGFVDISDVAEVTELWGVVECYGTALVPTESSGQLAGSQINCYPWLWRWLSRSGVVPGYVQLSVLARNRCITNGIGGITSYQCYTKTWKNSLEYGWQMIVQSSVTTQYWPSDQYAYCGNTLLVPIWHYYGFNLCFRGWNQFGDSEPPSGGFNCYVPLNTYIWAQ